MKILSISTDKKILEKNSEVKERMIEYGKLFDKMHIIVLNQNSKNKNKNDNIKFQISENTFIYPTNSRSKLFYIKDVVRIGKSIIQNSKFNIQDFFVTAQDPYETGLVAWLIAKKFKIKLQLQVHTDVFSPYFWQESFLNKIRVLMAKFLLPKADNIRVVSERIKESLKAKSYNLPAGRHGLKANLIVLPIFIDTERIKNTEPKNDLHKKYPQFDFIILMASRFTKEKNIPLAIEAFSEVVKKYPKAGLIIVGSGREEVELKFLSCKLKANIVFEEWTNDPISYYKTSDLFLLTSNYEGYGRTIIEAMAAGLPVISTDVGCAKESGATLAEHNMDDVAKKIIEFIENPKKPKLRYPYKTKAEFLELFKKQFI